MSDPIKRLRVTNSPVAFEVSAAPVLRFCRHRDAGNGRHDRPSRLRKNHQEPQRRNAMAANLVSIAMQFLTPEVIARIASFLGLEKSATQKAAGGSVPALLAGLSDLVSTPAGTNQFSKLLSQQPAISPADLLREGGPQGLVESGSNMLSALFGGQTMNAMAQVVGKLAGIGDSSGKSLLGMLGPIVLGALGQHQRTTGLDTGGLVSLLRSQKDQFTAAIPSGLADQLGAAGLIDNVTSAPGRASSAVSQTTYTATKRAAQWPYWLAALIVLGALGWYGFQRPGEEKVADQPPASRAATTGTVGMAPADLTVDGVNLPSKFNSSIAALKSTLPGINDSAAAQDALPKINDVTAQLNDISERAAKLSPDGRSAFAKLVVAARPSINEMCERVSAIPAV